MDKEVNTNLICAKLNIILSFEPCWALSYFFLEVFSIPSPKSSKHELLMWCMTLQITIIGIYPSHSYHLMIYFNNIVIIILKYIIYPKIFIFKQAMCFMVGKTHAGCTPHLRDLPYTLMFFL